ncbi:MAG: hybrid sensor histidine kinase/response regulator [Caldilineaceae bacterium]|nr:hybrid sensor histidine kinase/response regulator [Caldilineaceae bacterium]
MNSQTQLATQRMSKAPRVLVIDDDPRIQDTIEAQLYPEGYELLFKSSGVEAIRDLDKLKPDVILLDLMMPGMNGFDVCNHIKHREEFSHVPIIMVTALDDVDYLVTGLDTGADEFISKPVNGAELRARVRSMLRIKHQYDELDQALHLREIISRMIVHDMRNPLSSILLYAQVIQRKQKLPAEQMTQVMQIQSEAIRLGKLFDDMLVLSRMQRGQILLQRQMTDLAGILYELKEKYEEIARENSVKLIVATDPDIPTALFDTVLIERMLETLIANAINFSPHHGQVYIVLTNTVGEENGVRRAGVRLQVTDQGPDVPQDLFENIFEKLEHATYKALTRPATELGLAFCKMVVEAHTGKIYVEPHTPTGVVFTVELPCTE